MEPVLGKIKVSPFDAHFTAMKKLLTHNHLLPSSTSTYLSRQDLNFHTNTHFVQELKNSQTFKSVISTHSKVLKSGFLNDTFTTNHLINSYIRLHRIKHAHTLFDEMSERNVVSWTALMAAYTHNSLPETALQLFKTMPKTYIFPNVFTFATAISACSMLADLETGRKLHAHIEILGFQNNLVVCTALIDMYGKSNEIIESRRVFDNMVHRNHVSWTSMIAVYAQNARGDDALQLFREFNCLMSSQPNPSMLASVVNACASLGKLVAGKVSHGAVIRNGLDTNEVVSSALVDMYAKCGCVDYSGKIFRRIQDPCVIPYTSIIVGTAKHGLGEISLELFEEMIKKGIKPNDVTFLGVLHACNHSGLVEIGLQQLNSMYPKHGVTPTTKHYMCAVDMLGRVGRLDEAYHLAKSIPAKVTDTGILWGSLLSASRTHGRLDLALEASKRLIKSNQQLATAYVTMSNTYASVGNWENVYKLRSEMKREGVYKEPGCSWVEVKDKTYIFYAGDVLSCARGDEIVSVLKDLEVRMKERGYARGSKGLVFVDVEEEAGEVILGLHSEKLALGFCLICIPNGITIRIMKRGYARGSKGLVFVDVEEEAGEVILGLHSEKLALGFCLICIPNGITIRIMKNLRMCGDCHEAFKYISEIVQRDFVVRDVNRFHQFRDGSCTCMDFW